MGKDIYKAAHYITFSCKKQINKRPNKPKSSNEGTEKATVQWNGIQKNEIYYHGKMFTMYNLLKVMKNNMYAILFLRNYIFIDIDVYMSVYAQN